MSKRSEKVKEFVLENVETNPKDIVNLTAQEFSISRQAVNKHVNQLIAKKALTREGRGKSVNYSLYPQFEWDITLSLSDNNAEDVVWRNVVKKQLGELPDNALGIWHHGFSEMYNNAVDHSEGTTVTIVIKKYALSTEMFVMDNGIGIFTKIKNAINLLDERHAVIELTKGKLTTDPTRHSGEGIFFSSRMFDAYSILSGEVFLSHTYDKDEDWILQTSEYQNGTFITMKLKNNTTRTTQEIFDKFTDDDYGFTKTVVPVRLAQYGNEHLVSRSQAKRLLVRIERFKTVLFDFKDVESIGQAFADEVFRVFAKQHPNMEIMPLHANDAITNMIRHVKVNAEDTAPSSTKTQNGSSATNFSEEKKR